MPRYFRSTANKPGGGVRKGYRRGGRNLRDEEARVIGVQDNAADELRRVRARRPHDAAERRDRRAQLARVGSRERNARDEMARLRGYQYGGAIGRQAAAMGPAINRRAASSLALNPSWQALSTAQARGESAPYYGPGSRSTRGDEHIFGALSGYQYGGAIGRQAAAMGPAINRNITAANLGHNRYHAPDMNYIGMMDNALYGRPLDRTPRGNRYQYGGRVGFKTGGRIPRKKGTKFI